MGSITRPHPTIHYHGDSPMTVKQLKAWLSQFDNDAEVYIPILDDQGSPVSEKFDGVYTYEIVRDDGKTVKALFLGDIF
jgi:hypothetical protein